MNNKLKNLLEERKEVELVDELYSMLVNEIDKETLKNILYSFQKTLDENNEADVEYDDYLDDLIAAMEGWCDKDFKLHPNNLKKD